MNSCSAGAILYLLVHLFFRYLWCSEGSKTVMFVSELVLMRLELHKKDLFNLLLRCWQLHCPMEVAVHECMYQHEYRLFCNAKPMNQLVAYVGQPRDWLW
jgi:hypothetical protein